MKHFFVLLSTLICNFVNGQTITGLVSYEDSYLPAREVRVWTSYRNSTVTDSIGNYSIQISPSTKKIYFGSYLVFYEDLIEVDIKNDTVINVTLKMREAKLDELIVTAHAIPPQSSLAYSRKGKVTTIRETKEAELLNIEKQWRLVESNSMSFWTKVIYENINYPDTMLKNGIEGRVWAKFKIDVNGNLSDLEVIRVFAPEEIANEVLRTLKLMPNWLPYKEYYCSWLGGRNFNQLLTARGAIKYFGVFILPILFKIEYVKN